MSDPVREAGENWARISFASVDAEEDARYYMRDPRPGDPLTDWRALVACVRAREAAWRRLCDAVDAQQERERIRAEAER